MLFFNPLGDAKVKRLRYSLSSNYWIFGGKLVTLCPCGSEKDYDDCCGPYIEGKSLPEFPEQLMRSRYTAYTRADLLYIERTMAGEALNYFDPIHSGTWARAANWLGLTVVNTECRGDIGHVEFMVRYEINGEKKYLHEKSEFHRIDGRWFYTSGKTPKISPNAPCPCGSGGKFKKCCGSKI